MSECLVAAKNDSRNSFIDIAKFIFAIVIVLFHYGHGILPGGRMAVEGFFMISGYFMMKSLSKTRNDCNLGLSTLRFVIHKYNTLIYYLIPSVLMGSVVYAFVNQKNLYEYIKGFPLYLFDIIPLCSLGYLGNYSVGISWYISSMFFSLSVLYPLCKKFGKNFILCAGIPSALFIYGLLSHLYGNMAIPLWHPDYKLLPSAILRGLAGCLSGCILFVLSDLLKQKRLSSMGKNFIFLIEILSWAYFFYVIKHHPKSQYEFILVFVIFIMLLLGISGTSGIYQYYSTPKSNFLGTCSTLFVLNHYYWNVLLNHLNNSKTNLSFIPGGILAYFSMIIISSFFVYHIGNFLRTYIKKFEYKLFMN